MRPVPHVLRTSYSRKLTSCEGHDPLARDSGTGRGEGAFDLPGNPPQGDKSRNPRSRRTWKISSPLSRAPIPPSSLSGRPLVLQAERTSKDPTPPSPSPPPPNPRYALVRNHSLRQPGPKLPANRSNVSRWPTPPPSHFHPHLPPAHPFNRRAKVFLQPARTPLSTMSPIVAEHGGAEKEPMFPHVCRRGGKENVSFFFLLGSLAERSGTGLSFQACGEEERSGPERGPVETPVRARRFQPIQTVPFHILTHGADTLKSSPSTRTAPKTGVPRHGTPRAQPC